LGHLSDDSFNLVVWSESKTLEKLTAESPSWRFDMWFCPIYSRHARAIMPTEGVFSIQGFNYDTRVKERTAEEP